MHLGLTVKRADSADPSWFSNLFVNAKKFVAQEFNDYVVTIERFRTQTLYQTHHQNIVFVSRQFEYFRSHDETFFSTCVKLLCLVNFVC